MRFIPLLALILTMAVLPVQAYSAADATAPAAEVVPAPAADAAHGTDAGHEVADAAHGGESGGLPQLKIETYAGQAFWLAIMFVVLYTAFSFKILPSIGSVVHGREGFIKGNLDEAQALKDQAQAIQSSYEKTLEQARAKAIAAVQEVEASAKKKAADQLDAFRAKADGEMKSAEERVEGAKSKVMGDMHHVAAEVASDAAQKITGVSTDVQNAKAIVESIAAKKKAA